MKKTKKAFRERFGMDGVLFEVGELQTETHERMYPNPRPDFLLPDRKGLCICLVKHCDDHRKMTHITEYHPERWQVNRYGLLYTPAPMPLTEDIDIPARSSLWFTELKKEEVEKWMECVRRSGRGV